MTSSVNNWLGFSLTPQEPEQVDQSQNSVSRLGFNSSDECFDLTSASHIPSLNLPPFAILQGAAAFNRNTNHHSQDWSNMKDVSMDSGDSINYKTNSEMSSSIMLMENEKDQPKLENFLGVGIISRCNNNNNTTTITSSASYNDSNSSNHNGNNNNTSIGLSMIKTWLRNNSNNPTSAAAENKINGDDYNHHYHSHDDPQVLNHSNNNDVVTNGTGAQTLSLSMSTGGGGIANGTTNLAESTTLSDSSKQPTCVADGQNGGGALESMPRKSLDTFGQRTSIYRGVTRHRWTGRYEAHLWDNSCRREGQTRKGRQVYLGGYDKEEKAARAYDLAALKYWGTTTTTNFPISNYEKELEEMKHMTRQEYVASLRRKSSGFSRGASIYRGVTRHHQHGRWQARIGRVAGNKDLYLGTFSTQEEAAEAYDIAAIKFRGLSAVTNFEISRYDVKSILESTTLPIGGAAKRLKDAEQAEMALDLHRTNDESPSSHLTDGLTGFGGPANHGWPSISFQQTQPLNMHYPYSTHHQRLWCKQELDCDVSHQGFHDLNQIQLGGHTHNLLQPYVLHNLMNLDSSSIEHSSASNSVIYTQGSGDNNSNAAAATGAYNGNFIVPMGTTITQDQLNNHNGFGENEAKQIGYENLFGSADAYYHQSRNLCYQALQHQQQTSKTNSGVYDQEASTCNNWVPTAVPTIGARTSNMAAVCHGTFTVWNDT